MYLCCSPVWGLVLNALHIMSWLRNGFWAFILPLFFGGCEQEWTDMPTAFDEPEVVVEGYLEYADNALPPYVILTQSSPYLDTLGLNRLNDLFLHDALVRITDGTDTVVLTEVCWSDLQSLPADVQQSILQSFGITSLDSVDNDFNWCVYVDVSGFLGVPALSLQPGQAYHLYVRTADNRVVTATTVIPDLVLLDSVWYANHPDYPRNDSLVQTNIRFRDPGGIANYYRVFTRRNSQPMYPQGFAASTSDDQIVDGQEIQFFISRGQAPSEPFDPNTFGYFWRGDTATIRFATLDKAHFRFWKTTEYNTGSQGPFGSYVRIESNINGGLGVFGGISYTNYVLIID